MIHNGDCLEVLKSLGADSIDSLVTDPPAGISFMGKKWDSDKGGRDQWVSWMTDVMRECLRVMKPGAHGLVWAIPRTAHWTMTALENAGFEVRDVVTHLFGTGFPKSLDVSKAIDKAHGITEWKETTPNPAFRARQLEHDAKWQTSPRPPKPVVESEDAKKWAGFGTALKPACEFWILIRKPCSEKTVAKNVLKWGTGALNIDGCRIGTSDNFNGGAYSNNREISTNDVYGEYRRMDPDKFDLPSGRFPANLVLDEEAAAALDEQSGISKSPSGIVRGQSRRGGQMAGGGSGGVSTFSASGHGDSGGASRFFYVAKASKSDRGEDNKHPTVKSTKLMSYLCKLVTPPGGIVLDPFMGSGSTGIAAKTDNFRFIGIEKETDFYAIAHNRIKELA